MAKLSVTSVVPTLVCMCQDQRNNYLLYSSIVLFFLLMKGIMTGSIYNSGILQKQGFPGEHISNGSVIAIKTHGFSATEIAKYDRGILLIRDPFGCLLARCSILVPGAL